jgi:hypothetical protein
MATKWADYLISAVRYNSAGTHIDKVRVHPDYGDKVGPGAEYTRTRVVSLIGTGNTFATITRSAAGQQWNLGAKVAILQIDGAQYLRTRPDRTKADNLDNLPTF